MKNGKNKMKLIIICCLIVFLIYFIFQQGRFRINNERVGFMLLKGGYRAWWLRYSNGATINNKGEWTNLWCRPRFEHCDARRSK